MDRNFTAYQDHVDSYLMFLNGGITGGLNPEQRAHNFQKFLKSGKVLEIGSGVGLDAIELEKLGFEVIPTDFVDSFINLMKEKSLSPLKFDAKYELLPMFNLEGVFANAVFVHFNKNDLEFCSENIFIALKQNGILFFSVMQGSGSEISNKMNGIEREFFYYQKEDLIELLEKVGFQVLEITENVDNRWIHVYAKRP